MPTPFIEHVPCNFEHYVPHTVTHTPCLLYFIQGTEKGGQSVCL